MVGGGGAETCVVVHVESFAHGDCTRVLVSGCLCQGAWVRVLGSGCLCQGACVRVLVSGCCIEPSVHKWKNILLLPLSP